MKLRLIGIVCLVASSAFASPLFRAWVLQQPTRDWVVLLDTANTCPVIGKEERQTTNTVTIPPEIVQGSQVFAYTMARNFGPGAHTNQNVTASAVGAHFTARQMAGTISVMEIADAVTLQAWFDRLAQFSPDGTTWSFPWGQTEATNTTTCMVPICGPSPAQSILGRLATREDILDALDPQP